MMEPVFPLGSWLWGIIAVVAGVGYWCFDRMEQKRVKEKERENIRRTNEGFRQTDESFRQIEDILLDGFGKKVKLRISARAGSPTASFNLTTIDPPPPDTEE